jgi:hypothetical protein
MGGMREQALVESFIDQLAAEQSPWGDVQVAREFDYRRGRTDIVACTASDSVIAIEAKLTDWRGALHQAFRNRCFAHQSYVLLPKDLAFRAHQFAGEFDRRRVGICYLDDGQIIVLHPAIECDPIEPWLSARAKGFIDGGGAAL